MFYSFFYRFYNGSNFSIYVPMKRRSVLFSSDKQNCKRKKSVDADGWIVTEKSITDSAMCDSSSEHQNSNSEIPVNKSRAQLWRAKNSFKAREPSVSSSSFTSNGHALGNNISIQQPDSEKLQVLSIEMILTLFFLPAAKTSALIEMCFKQHVSSIGQFRPTDHFGGDFDRWGTGTISTIKKLFYQISDFTIVKSRFLTVRTNTYQENSCQWEICRIN